MACTEKILVDCRFDIGIGLLRPCWQWRALGLQLCATRWRKTAFSYLFYQFANATIDSNHRRGIQLPKEAPSALGKRVTRKHQP